MTTKFFAILTNLGAAKLANATALGTQLQITHMAVGDGGGVLPLPNAAQTQLIGEKRRAALNSLSVDAANSSQIIAEQVIPETDGGWWIREIGLFDKDGVLIAIANCPETYKPQLQEGSGRTQTVRMVLIVSSTEAVTLKIDPSVVLATRKYADDKAIEVKSYADGLMVAHLAAADPHSQYAPKASPALTGKPTAPTAAKTDNSTQLATTAHIKLALADYAPLASPVLTGTPTTPTAGAGSNTQQLANTAFVQAAIAALVASSPAALDTLKELADALGNDPNFATTMTNALAGKMDKAKNGSDIANVATFLENLGLGDAAKKSVGTGVNQIPDMSSFISSFAQNGYFKFPGGLIIQWGEVTGSTTATVPANFPIPFPNALMSTALAIDLIGPSYATLQNQTLGGISVNTWNSAGNRAALAIRYIAIGW
ncbi:phage tail protein [Yersinia enterocolitica]|nr:phage tail protein [Yersinia enterocolitica]HDL6689789.1 phage tail protein [Yersinia enterocolitica]HDY3769954.1 phage tail protein [Yersinia enterocolitica]